ncbi:MAG: hypothetical protein J6D06_06780 [Clostridia bacterium]|nr:hypothetical protein [Clostridia bacterium]
MIKGVNKQVLEITETQNGFFEKAIFFVKPEYSGMSEGKLRESAKKELENAGNPPLTKLYPQQRVKTIFFVGGALILGIIMGLAFSALS